MFRFALVQFDSFLADRQGLLDTRLGNCLAIDKLYKLFFFTYSNLISCNELFCMSGLPRWIPGQAADTSGPRRVDGHRRLFLGQERAQRQEVLQLWPGARTRTLVLVAGRQLVWSEGALSHPNHTRWTLFSKLKRLHCLFNCTNGTHLHSYISQLD